MNMIGQEPLHFISNCLRGIRGFGEKDGHFRPSDGGSDRNRNIGGKFGQGRGNISGQILDCPMVAGVLIPLSLGSSKSSAIADPFCFRWLKLEVPAADFTKLSGTFGFRQIPNVHQKAAPRRFR